MNYRWQRCTVNGVDWLVINHNAEASEYAVVLYNADGTHTVTVAKTNQVTFVDTPWADVVEDLGPEVVKDPEDSTEPTDPEDPVVTDPEVTDPEVTAPVVDKKTTKPAAKK